MILSGIATDDALVLATTADDEWRLLGATILRTQEQRLTRIVASFLKGDSNTSLAARVVGASPFSCHSQGIMNALTFMDDDIATESVTRY